MTDKDHLDKLWIAAGKRVAEREYWLDKLAGELSENSFPSIYEGSKETLKPAELLITRTANFRFDKKISSKMIKASTGSNIRLFILLTAVLILLLRKYTGSNDIIIASSVLRSDFPEDKDEELINKVLILRNLLTDHMTFKELLIQVKGTIIEADKHQNYPIEVLLKQLNLSAPPFDVAILVENIHDRQYLSHVKPAVIFSFSRTDNEIEGQVEYLTSAYQQETILRLIDHYRHLAEIILDNAEITVSAVELLLPAEKKQLLYDFNSPAVEYPADKSIRELFEQQVEKTPDNIAVIGVKAKNSVPGQDRNAAPSRPVNLSYGKLNLEADRSGFILIEKGVKPGAAIGIMMERSIEMIIGILGIFKTGAAYLPIDTDYPGERKEYMLKDSSVRILLTTRSLAGKIKNVSRWAGEIVYIDKSGIQTLHSTPKVMRSTSSSESLAYIMYTSGSTGMAKGVMIGQRNVVRLVKNTNYVELSAETRIIQTGAPVFDATTFEIWGPLLNGGILYLVNKEDILSASRLGKAILRNKINTLWLSAPFFNQLMQQDSEIFSGLKYLLVGGDVLTPKFINMVREKNKKLKVINGYGPTENTTFSTTYSVEKDFQQNIPIGKPINNSTAFILDRNDRLQPVGAAGELCVGGDGVSRGYLNRPGLTSEKFINNPFGAGFLYRTGDLVRWLPDGNIEFLSRMDYQVKIRGFRVEPGEIESQLLKHPEIEEAVVLTGKEQGDKYICAYVIANSMDHGAGSVKLKEYLTARLPDYMIPSYFVFLEKMPLTTNGKIDYRALPNPEARAAGIYAAPQDEMQEKMVEIWSSVLRVEKEKIGIDDDFFELGGHSLNSTALVSRIYKEFEINIELEDVFAHPTIRELSRCVEGFEEIGYVEITPVEEKEYYALSSAQERLFILQQFDMSILAYNTPSVMELTGVVAKERLASVFRKLIARHEILRTSFRLVAGEPAQIINPPHEVEFKIEYYDKSDRQETASEREKQDKGEPASRNRQPKTVKSIIEEFISPFNLSRASLLRVGLIKNGQDEYILMLDMHHIISDGTSMGIFVKEFMAFYEGNELPGLRLQYRDYAEWQNNEKEGKALKQQETFWLQEFDGEIPVLDLPYDFLRPKVQSFLGSTLICEINSKEIRALQALASEQGATLFMILLAVYDIFLAKLSNQQVVVVGTPTAGRHHADLEPIFGMFVNTLPLKDEPAGEKTFLEFLREVKERTLQAFANQDYQYEELVEHLPVNRDTGRNPLFDTMLVLQNLDMPEIEIPGLKLRPLNYHPGIAKFDLMLTCIETNDKLSVTFEYCSRLFKKETVEKFIRYFKKVISTVVEEPDRKISGIEIISEKEKNRLLVDFNRTEAEYPRDKTVHQLFEEQAARIPDHIAIIGIGHDSWGRERNKNASPLQSRPSEHLTYRELNQKAGRLAGLLKEEGLSTDSVTGLFFAPCILMMIGMIGILKAGGAYLPIDPAIPVGRIEYMLEDAALPVLLTHSEAVGEIDFAGKIIFLDRQVLPGGSGAAPAYEAHPENLAYVIYTSGSTGRPKGVAVEHSQLVNFVYHMYNRYDGNVDFNDRCLSLTNIMFDVSVWEFFLPLSFGARLVLLPGDKRFDVFALTETILRQEINLIYLPPGLLKPVCEELKKKTGSLKLNKMLVGVEPIRDEVLEDYMRLNPRMRIINGYGPTETTICASSFNYSSQEPQGEIVPIGVPLSNNQIVLLDDAGFLVPQGIPGEICISGDGVSRGYLNNPELTAYYYTPHPYIAGKRMYKTGDLARLLAGGNIRFVGRRDQQLKIRGYRIELGEIESRLLKHKDIKQPLVLVKTDGQAGKYLCAYFTSDIELEPSALREYLARDLPDYMIPSYFMQIEQIPLTANGKLDKKALPEPEVGTGTAVYIAPRNNLESKLAEIWCEVLALNPDEPPGIDHDFFELGGQSLKAAALMSKIHKELDVKVDLVGIIQKPTIREIASLIKTIQLAAKQELKTNEETVEMML